jgi:hypothetical protein
LVTPLIRSPPPKVTTVIRPLPPKVTPLIRPLPPKATPLIRSPPPKVTTFIRPLPPKVTPSGLIRGVTFGGSGLIRRRLLYNIFFIICCLNCIYVYVLFVSAGKDVVWFDRYGRKNGFIVYILRYFLLQNWGRNLHIVDKEFLALAAMAFGRPKEKQYQQIALRRNKYIFVNLYIWASPVIVNVYKYGETYLLNS